MDTLYKFSQFVSTDRKPALKKKQEIFSNFLYKCRENQGDSTNSKGCLFWININEHLNKV